MPPPIVSLGDTGDRVRGLQEALVHAGISPGAVDGTFGPRTQAAVRRLQQLLGLAVTGVLDPHTAASLEAARPADAPPVLYRNPANPYQRHLMPDDRAPRRRGSA